MRRIKLKISPLYNLKMQSVHHKPNSTSTQKNQIPESMNQASTNELSNELEKLKIWNFKNPKTNEIYKNYFIFSYFNDNYGYILNDQKTQTLIGIDFGDFERSKIASDKVANLTNSKLKYILTTHAHSDHSGGNGEWKELLKNELQIISGDTPKCKVHFSDKFVKDNEDICFGNIKIKVLHTPGHIQSHVCYVVSDSELDGQPFAFTGDTLFSAGCGRVFSGTHEEMLESLTRLRGLSKETMVFCGHEYTLKNLQFALSLEPDSEIIKSKIKEVEKTLEEGKPTMGSLIGDELKYNPFLRCDEDYFKKKFDSEDPVEIFKIIRKMKDKF